MTKILDFDTAVYYDFCDLEDQDGNLVDYEGEFQREWMSTRTDEPLDLNAWLESLQMQSRLNRCV